VDSYEYAEALAADLDAAVDRAARLRVKLAEADAEVARLQAACSEADEEAEAEAEAEAETDEEHARDMLLEGQERDDFAHDNDFSDWECETPLGHEYDDGFDDGF